MKQELTVQQQKQSVQINRFAYILFLLLVAYLLVRGDIEWATVNMGIALTFDPFDPNVRWQARPLYQRVWLLVHVCLTFSGFIFLLVR